MSDWRTATIDSQVQIERGFAFRSSDYSSEGHFILRVTNLEEDGRVSKNDVVFLDRRKVALYPSYQLSEGDILLVMVGATTGKFARVSADVLPALLNQNIWNLKPATAELHKPFFYYSLHDIIERFLGSSQGSARDFLKQSDFKNIGFLLPPLPQQRKIARILTTVDNLIEKTEALIAKYQAIKQGMMHDLFTRGVDEHGHLRPPYEQAPELYKQSELGWIPKEWEAQKLGEALRIAGGYLQTGPFGSQLHSYEYVTEGIPVVMPQDITGGHIFTDQIARITKTKADSMARHRLRFNDVVFSRRGDLSRAAAISSNEEGWICGTGCFLLRCSPDRLDANWITRQYAMPHVQRQVGANAVGSTMPSLNNAVMDRLLMLIPRPPEQAELGRRIVALESVHENLRSELHKLSLTKTGLMQDLLTGKVRVKVDEAELTSSTQ